MSKLEAALAWAARGFRVFPLRENGKEPLFGMDEWYDYATLDESRIRMYWIDPVLGVERNYNIGVDCTDMVVVDIDVKDGKNGLEEYAAISGEWATLCVLTPTGGYHLYFTGPDSSNSPISPAIDIRSHHGYVVGPGSEIDGRRYDLYRDMEPAWLPLAVETRLTPLKLRDVTAEYTSVDDTPAKIEAVTNYLNTAPVAVEGNRGDDTTFQTAARCVREFGLSVYKTFELMRDLWNPRCEPPWGLDELLKKVENAAEYGTAELGRLDAATLFGKLDIPPPPTVFEQSPGFGVSEITEAVLRARDWLIDRMLLIGHITLIVAVGSVGKSTFGLALAAHLALGVPFGNYKPARAVKSIIYNGEDDVEEQRRRLVAVCMTYGLDYNAVRPRIMLLSEEEVDLRLVVPMQGGGAQPSQAIVDQLIGLASDPEVGLLILDPLIDVHGVNEGEPGQMNVVMKTLRHIAKKAQVAELIMHHATKGGNEKQEQRIGNMDIARGSTAIINKSRIAYTLMNASETDAEAYGMQQDERRYWLRLDDAKMNLGLAGDKPQWFKRDGVKLLTGDVVGIIRPYDLQKSTSHIRMRIADIIIENMQLINQSTMAIIQVIALVKAQEPLWANKTDVEVRQRLEQFFATAVMVRENTLKLVRDGAGKVLLVLS